MHSTTGYGSFGGEVNGAGTLRMLTPEASRHLNAIATASSYPANITLYREHETLRNVYLIMDGEVKLSMNASDGRCLDLRIARKGEILGLRSALAGTVHQTTARTVNFARLAPVAVADFLGFLGRYPSARETLSEVAGWTAADTEQPRALRPWATTFEPYAFA
jgi:CRP/FNR family transcriptional regulator